MRFALAALVLALASGTARADDVASYDADGDADASLADPRTAALDDAFANAVNSAINELVDEDARTAHRADLDKEIVGRARLWVAKFTVTKEGTSGDRKQLSVAVRVDRDKMLARLEELGVPTKLVTVALRVQTGPGMTTRATFGEGGEKDVPGLAGLAATLRAGGWAVKRAPLTGTGAKPDGVLPLDDDEAFALGGEAHADVVAVASASVSASVPVRGLDADAVAVTAIVRLVDRKKHEALGQGTAIVGARLERGADAKDMNKAIERSLAAAAADVVPQGPQTIASGGSFTGSDTPIGEAGTVLVRLAPKTPWGFVSAELKYLQGAKGIKSAVLRRLSPGGWVIGVATAESIEKIASIAKKPPTADATVKVKVANEIIDVTLGVAQ